eukprot:gene15678-biopygen11413
MLAGSDHGSSDAPPFHVAVDREGAPISVRSTLARKPRPQLVADVPHPQPGVLYGADRTLDARLSSPVADRSVLRRTLADGEAAAGADRRTGGLWLAALGGPLADSRH